MKRLLPPFYLRLAFGLAILGFAASAHAQTLLRTHAGVTNLERFGASISGGGDTNGDGCMDYAAGSPGFAGLGVSQGQVRWISGANGSDIRVLTGVAAGDQFGHALHLGGDLDLDGRADLIVGAPTRDAGLGAEQGEARVYSGIAGALLYTISGSAAGDRTGSAVAILPDLNADGRAEFAIGHPLRDGPGGADAGALTIHDGALGTVLWTIDGVGAGDRLGSSVSYTIDLNSDGISDQIVGAPGTNGMAGADCGAVLVISGSNGTVLATIEGVQAAEEFGHTVAGAGDCDHDGRGDWIAGSPLFDGVAGTDCGRIVLRSGGGVQILAVEGATAGDRHGAAVASGQDVDADGFTDLVVGAPGFDGGAGGDCGKTSVYRGFDGSPLFSFEGLSAADTEGGAVALLDDTLSGARAEVLSGAPDRNGAGTGRGQIRLFESSAAAAASTHALGGSSSPIAQVHSDVDGDGDDDLLVAGSNGLTILWNGDHLGTDSYAEFAALAPTVVALSAGATPASICAGQLDSDLGLEVVIGRSDGSVDILDATGSGNTIALSLTMASPISVDNSVSPGAIAGCAVRGSGMSASVVCAAAGSFVVDGFAAEITTPLTAPVVGTALLAGGSFTDVVVHDLDNDGSLDLLLANNSAGPSGGLHVLLGPTLTPATGSPYVAGGPPRTLAALDLDGNGIRSDVATSSLDLSGGGVRLWIGFGMSGFTSNQALGFSLARDVAAGEFDATAGEDLAVLDGAGNLTRHVGWTGMAFGLSHPVQVSRSAGFRIEASEFTPAAPGLCATDEISVTHFAADLVSVWRLRRLFETRSVALTGCPTTGPLSQVALSEEPLIGRTSLLVRLSNATPLSLAFLVIGVQTPIGGTPSTATTGGCGYVQFTTDYSQYLTFTSLTGGADLPAGIPLDPCLIGQEFNLQWAVLDGGPILSAITVSNAVTVRIGEP